MATNKTTRMDAQGRVILPPHIRKEMNLTPGQLLAVALEGNTITVRPAEERCAFCGEATDDQSLSITKTTRICKACAKKIVELVEKENMNG